MRSSLSSSTLTSCTTIVLVAVTIGCANWQATDADFAKLDTPLTDLNQSRHTPVIEVTFAGLVGDAEDADQADSIWQWVDETKIDAVQRRRLLANGIRAGFVSNEDQFRRRLADQTTDADVLDEFLTQASIKSDVAHGTQRLPLRFGRRYELPLRQPIEGSEVTLVRVDGETVGKTLLRPQHILGITAHRGTSTNQIELQMRPEIQHGNARQKWITSDSALRIDTRRETWTLPELDLDVAAQQGDLLVISADAASHGLANKMFAGTSPDGAQQTTMLLIEVVQLGDR